MNILKLSRRNVTENRWRSLSLGSFIFLATVLMLFFNSFIITMQDNYYVSMRDSLTGDLQIRSANTLEDDMLSLKGRWGEMAYLQSADVAAIEQVLQAENTDYVKRLRNNAMLVQGDIKQHAALIGVDLKANHYQNVFTLTDGKYLDPSRSDEVLLPKTYAEKLKVKVGDKVDVEATTKDNKTVRVTRTVAGIGDVDRLSSFSFFPVYTSLEGAVDLTGLSAGEATDLILYTGEKAEDVQASLVTALASNGVDASKAKLTLAKDMGGFINGIVSLYVMAMYSFIAVLLVVMTLLIINLIFMMGLERRQEVGTLRAIGFSRAQVVWIFMGEMLIITAIAFLIGLVVGVALILTLSKVGITFGGVLAVIFGAQFYFQFSATQILPVVAIIFGFILLVSFYPSFKSASIRPSETLREA